MEYATSKYAKNFKAIVISNMQSSFPEYAAYNNKLRSRIDPDVIALMEKYESKGDFLNPEYDALVMKHYYSHHVCRIVPFPDGVQRAMDHHNQHIYELMQGPSEFVPGGLLADWDITDKLSTIIIPSLMVGAKHDTMDPEAMKKQASLVQKGRYLHCPNGSHMCMWDDQDIYFTGIIKFIEDVESGTF
ncbi:hypothetical protein SARC_05185 [Sphaeroforma arctica JP610]|uniref:Proline iminopeptidase n=1 Tax=Sphaeroforma arctica JP610 TaxID=667725 RepID=A0A0L0G095_9EUKA|nr:hypothetical protein SARC_05185 [Sphaeroforma arctica JP610]KNC82537.1 hypothetical protein SARC_05185 [Sphaeroforma arctica JP610]|eukprot:XP_014156439.1 hypothetical protein SARC_05185 [Sphaeroforma arctica JP610]